jgi:hypothetical protein
VFGRVEVGLELGDGRTAVEIVSACMSEEGVAGKGEFAVGGGLRECHFNPRCCDALGSS